VSNFKHFKLWTPLLVLSLVNGVGYYDPIERTGIDPVYGVAAQHAMRNQGVHFRGTLFLQQFGGSSDGVGSIREIVDQDGRLARYFADKHHGGILAVGDLSRTTFLEKVSSISKVFEEPSAKGIQPCELEQTQSQASQQLLSRVLLRLHPD
jgi:hypothetical protein